MAKRSSLAALVDDAGTEDGIGGSGGNTTKAILGGSGSKAIKTTISFDQDDYAELDRIEEALRGRGIRVRERTALVRMALRLALAERTTEEVAQLADALAERWKRGG